MWMYLTDANRVFGTERWVWDGDGRFELVCGQHGRAELAFCTGMVKHDTLAVVRRKEPQGVWYVETNAGNRISAFNGYTPQAAAAMAVDWLDQATALDDYAECVVALGEHSDAYLALDRSVAAGTPNDSESGPAAGTVAAAAAGVEAVTKFLHRRTDTRSTE